MPAAEPTLAAYHNPLARRPEALDPAIRATIGAALLHGALLCGALFAARI